jgi:hypothetical protein
MFTVFIDRKLLAVAVVAKASIVNATDSDWAESADLLNQLGINVNSQSSKAIVKSAHCSKRAMHFNSQSIEACSLFSFATIATLVSMTKTSLFII